MMERPYIVYADTEATLIKTGHESKIHKHVPNSACFYLVCTYDETQNRLWHSVGENCIVD